MTTKSDREYEQLRLSGLHAFYGESHILHGIDMVVNSHILVADEMFDIARSHGALDVHMFANNRIELAEVEL